MGHIIFRKVRREEAWEDYDMAKEQERMPKLIKVERERSLVL